ncbi:AzlC protein [Synechococcus sp. PCC 7335]|uniref:AzlC family ABC transporter permease n=1 Tax=Synechococcus sp. (strain ATCC 29403 / PCC 7335) TaxID=91464 RepID=UPI00017ECEB4|nr:AzlC family ABC transporter permease [Synechococcus sp. PCC 7335]EDX87135.1 AzlC protein [Synechococcus sp. PCC 7335]
MKKSRLSSLFGKGFFGKDNPPTHPTPRSEFWAGMRDIIPLIVGAIPFGIIFGTLATASGLSAHGTLAMSLFVFAGSSQFIAVGLIAAKTSWLLIVLTTFVVNLRHLLYAVSLLPYVKKLPQLWKVPMAFWLTDETFAVGVCRYESSAQSTFKHWYYLGAALAMYLNWQLCTLLGITVGQLVPNAADWGSDFAMSVTFIGMIVPYVKNKPMSIAVGIAGVTALLGYGLPHKLGLMVAAITGISAGMLCEKMLNPKQA